MTVPGDAGGEWTVDGPRDPERRDRRVPPVRWIAGALALVVVLVGAVALVVSRDDGGPQGAPDGSAGSPLPDPPPGSRKPPLQGLAMQQVRPLTDADAGAFSARVVLTTWADVQPTPALELARDNVIDRELRATAAFNRRHPDTPVYLKLRVQAGIYAPEWVKRLDGFEPVPVTHVQTDRPGTLGAFWSTEYLDAYADLQRLLAERYDDEPLIRDNAISGCMTVFAEPFQRDLTGFDELFAQGYSVAADEECLRQQVDAHAPWRHTHQSLAVNPFRPWTMEDGELGRADPDIELSLSVMDHCRETLGGLCTLSNNSIRSEYAALLLGEEADTSFLSNYATLYGEMKELGPPLSFQTAAPSRVGDLSTTVEAAVTFGANAVEVPVPYDPDSMARDNAALLGNPHAPE